MLSQVLQLQSIAEEFGEERMQLSCEDGVAGRRFYVRDLDRRGDRMCIGLTYAEAARGLLKLLEERAAKR